MIMNCNFDKLTLNLLTKEELVELLEKCQDNKLTENTNKIDSIDNELLKIKKQYEYQKKKLKEYNTKTHELLDKINREKKLL